MSDAVGPTLRILTLSHEHVPETTGFDVRPDGSVLSVSWCSCGATREMVSWADAPPMLLPWHAQLKAE